MYLIFRQYYKGIFIRLVSAGGIISLFLTFMYLIGINPLQFKVFPFFGSLYGLLTFVIPLLLWWRTNKAFKDSALFDNAVQGVLSEDLLTLTTGQLQRKINREDILKKEIICKDILLYTARESFLYIPGGQLNDQSFKVLCKWIDGKD
jgi:hypothetical protein